MSDDAIRLVQACSHPRVTEVARELLNAIARLIPEGKTTTPLIGMGELATLANMHRRTVWTWLPTLVEIGEVRIVDGGQGRPARYTLVHLAGAAPISAIPLPLVGATPRRKPAPLISSTSRDLPFEPTSVRSESEELVIGSQVRITSWAARTITRITSWVVATITRIARITSTRPFVRSAGEELVIGTCDPCDPLAPPLEVPIDSRARDVLQLSSTTTTEEKENPRPSAVMHPWHAWCGGRVHVPKDLHPELLVKLGRFPNETDAAQEARLIAFYERTCAALPSWETVPSEYKFWNRAFAAEFSTPAAPARGPLKQPRSARRGAAPMPIYDYDAPEAVARRQRQDEAEAWREAQAAEASAVIDAMSPDPRASLEATAARELTAFKAGMTSERYTEAVRRVMIRLVVEARQRERKSG